MYTLKWPLLENVSTLVITNQHIDDCFTLTGQVRARQALSPGVSLQKPTLQTADGALVKPSSLIRLIIFGQTLFRRHRRTGT